MGEPPFTAAELAEFKAYHSAHYVFGVVVEVYGALLTAASLVWLRRWWSASERLVAWLQSKAPALPVLARVMRRVWGGDGWAQALGFAAMLVVVNAVAFFPFDLYFGFVREKAYGLATESLVTFLVDYLKMMGLGSAALTAVVLGLFGLARRFERWWLVMAVVCSALLLVSAAIDPYRSRLYFEQQPLPAGELRERIGALMAKAGIEVGEVVVEQTSTKTVRLQAYFAGQGPTRTIVLSDSLLEQMAVDQVLAAVAHEAGHVKEPRWPGYLGSVLALTGFLALVEWLMRRAAARGWWGITGRGDVRVLPLVLTVFWLSTSLVAPVSAWFQRERELAADRFGLELTHDAGAFRRMLTTAARVNKMDPTPPAWVVLRGWSHPPISKRLERVGED